MIIKGTSQPNLVRAARILRRGGIVAFPTETVYGLGADARNPDAVCKIFEAKKRPTFNPLIVHVSSVKEAQGLWKRTPGIARRLLNEFSPGPLTIVLPKKELIPDIVTAGLNTVAIRIPAHPVALELLKVFGGPLAAPSANLFGCTSPTTAGAVEEDLGGTVDLILDGGRCAVGIESTVVKIEQGACILLRPGAITIEMLRKIIPVKRSTDRVGVSEPRRSPGMLRTHYAPRTPMVLMDCPYPSLVRQLDRIRDIGGKDSRKKKHFGLLLFKRKKNIPRYCHAQTLSSAGSLHEAACNLFEAIRKLDKIAPDAIIAEPVPFKGIGFAIMDRLMKACSYRIGVKHLL